MLEKRGLRAVPAAPAAAGRLGCRACAGLEVWADWLIACACWGRGIRDEVLGWCGARGSACGWWGDMAGGRAENDVFGAAATGAGGMAPPRSVRPGRMGGTS